MAAITHQNRRPVCRWQQCIHSQVGFVTQVQDAMAVAVRDRMSDTAYVRQYTRQNDAETL